MPGERHGACRVDVRNIMGMCSRCVADVTDVVTDVITGQVKYDITDDVTDGVTGPAEFDITRDVMNGVT